MLENSIDQINQLSFDPDAICLHNGMYLIWTDEGFELPLHRDDRSFLKDLWLYRGYLHLEHLPEEERARFLSCYESHIDYLKYYEAAWQYALQIIPNWPGFKRLTLSVQEAEYLEKGDQPSR